ncbi:hypothetical protein [Streptomyces niger]|uniref:hypothetical protein n=1 Tax=Streptomyces niger TaxID=66373 RepID=UPI0022770A21|nr:hypothetical protein [Streptomyces niger]
MSPARGPQRQGHTIGDPGLAPWLGRSDACARTPGTSYDLTPAHPPAAVPRSLWTQHQQRELFSEERALMAGRRPRRVCQFTTARTRARRCLAQLGFPAVPLLPGTGGAPRWPDGPPGRSARPVSVPAPRSAWTGRSGVPAVLPRSCGTPAD